MNAAKQIYTFGICYISYQLIEHENAFENITLFNHITHKRTFLCNQKKERTRVNAKLKKELEKLYNAEIARSLQLYKASKAM